MDYINQLSSIKALYTNKKLIEDNFFNFLNIEKDFDQVEELHTYLINNVNKILADESSDININLCKTSFNVLDVLNKCEDAKVGGKIYFLNNKATTNYIFGDIHSDSTSIISFLKKIKFIEKIQANQNLRLIFLGDYVDRGKAQYRTLELILMLKFIFKGNVFLLRGNHDGGTIVSDNEYKLCVGRNNNTTDKDYFVASIFNTLKKSNKSLTLLQNYLDFFNSLCHIAFIKNGNEVIQCVHGGIPRPTDDNYDHIHTISDLYNEDIIDNLNGSIIHNMLWSDPTEDVTLQRNTRRFYFYETHFNSFTNKFSISKIIRGHEAFNEGYKEFFQGRLLSIFSSGKAKVENTETAYNDINPCILKLHNGTKEIIRLEN